MKKVVLILLVSISLLSSCNLKPELYDRIITNDQLIDGLSQSFKNRTMTPKEFEDISSIVIKNARDSVACKSAFLAIHYLEHFTLDQLKKECK